MIYGTNSAIGAGGVQYASAGSYGGGGYGGGGYGNGGVLNGGGVQYATGGAGYRGGYGNGGVLANGGGVQYATGGAGYGAGYRTGEVVANGGGVQYTAAGAGYGAGYHTGGVAVNGGAATYPIAGPGMGGAVGPGGDGGVIVEPNPSCGCGVEDTGCCVGGPGAACGGVGTACCEEAGTAITSTGWKYVGGGNGAFAASAPSYSFVGQGAGAWTKEVIATPYGCKLRPCCILLALLALLLPLLFMLLRGKPAEKPVVPIVTVAPAPAPIVRPTPPPAPIVTPTPAPPQLGPIGSCIVFGDPHVKSFDHEKTQDYYSPGEYWIVKSKRVWIQGRYLPTRATSGLGVTKILAVGGPFLQGHKLFVSSTWATWDGQPILQGFPSDFKVPGLVEMQYNDQGELLQKGRTGLALHVVHIKLNDGSPEGIVIQVNRWTLAAEGNYINVRITMHAQPGQDGHCGNFNGNPADDDRVKVRARVGKTGVDPSQLLFKKKTPVVEANRPNINDCPASQLADCKDTCKKKEGKFIPSMACLVDCCFGGKGFAEQG